MAFQLIGPNTMASIDDQGVEIFELPDRYGEPVAFLPRLQALFYES